ncbi:MAG: hypothetical protein QXL86_03155 [Candidatus Aenigmatarchaeota archaeon]
MRGEYEELSRPFATVPIKAAATTKRKAILFIFHLNIKFVTNLKKFLNFISFITLKKINLIKRNMKKLLVAMFAIALFLFGIFFLSVYGIRSISTDKKVYSLGEEAKIYWSSLSLEWCTCPAKRLRVEIFREALGWQEVQHELHGKPNERVCADGQVVVFPMPCDIIRCSFPVFKSRSGIYTWNLKEYERRGTTSSCLFLPTNETISQEMPNYISKNVPPGKYKIQFGIASTMIEIV